MKNQSKIDAPEKRWEATKGRTFLDRTAGSTRCRNNKKVAVIEKARSLTIPSDNPNSSDPYGIPINAKLAINLISDFHSYLKGPFLEKFINGKEIDLDKIQESFLKKGGRESFTKDDFQDILNKLVDMLKRSCAITIDKNVILKTLSQPGCEGIRFYLCKKTICTDREILSTGNTTNEDYVSLVTVGVDEFGCDHLYKYSKNQKTTRSSNIKQGQSLLSEYGHPPGGRVLTGKNLTAVYDKEHYPLLAYALEITNKNRKRRTKDKK